MDDQYEEELLARAVARQAIDLAALHRLILALADLVVRQSEVITNLTQRRTTMRKREHLSDPNSCMNRARDDEEVFVLLGRDAAAIAAVRAWIDARIRLGKNLPGDAQLLDAEAWIERVRDNP